MRTRSALLKTGDSVAFLASWREAILVPTKALDGVFKEDTTAFAVPARRF